MEVQESDQPGAGERGEPRSLLRRAFLLLPGEAGPGAWSAAYAFFLFAGYYMLRPLRDELGVAGGVRHLPWLVLATLCVMAAAHPVYVMLLSRLGRRRFIPRSSRFFMLSLIVLFAAVRLAPEEWQRALGRGVYIWTSVFNLFAVSVFWSFMADLYRPDQAKRLFGLIAIGGTLGAIVGAGAASLLAVWVGPELLLLAAAATMEPAVRCVSRIARKVRPRRAAGDRRNAEPEPGLAAGAAAIVRSGHLLRLCGYMLLFTVTSTLLYFEQARIVSATYATPAERTAFFARIDLWANVLTLTVQLLAAGRVMGRLGVGPVLALTPLVTIAGAAALAVSPTAGVLMAVQVARRGVHYAFDRPARAVLFTVLGREERYKSKNLIDTVVYRAGDLAGALPAGLAPAVFAAGGAALAAVVLPLSMVWMLLGLRLGTGHRRLEEAGSGAPVIAAENGLGRGAGEPAT